jgi:hypothetical protein
LNGIKEMGESLEFINILIRTKKILEHNYNSAMTTGKPIIFLHYMLYGDGFSWLDKSQQKAQYGT